LINLINGIYKEGLFTVEQLIKQSSLPNKAASRSTK